MANSTSDRTDSPDPSATEPADKGKTLAAQLEEFNRANQGKAVANDASQDELKALRAEVQRLQGIEAGRSYRKEMDDYMIPQIAGETKAHPKIVEAWLNEQADSDPRLRKAWENREEDRTAFEEAVATLKPKFEAYAEKEGLKGTAKGAPADMQKKLQAAVRSARETQSDTASIGNVDIVSMSDQEFALHKAEVFRLAQAGQLQ